MLLVGVAGLTLLAVRSLARRRGAPLAGHVALVTGGSRGLGLCIAEELTRRGMHVAILARDPRELRAAAERLRKLGEDAMTVVADVRRAADAERAIAKVMARFGRLDWLVNNAGVITVGPLSEMSLEDFEDQMAVHFWGPLRLAVAALPHLEGGGHGRIVNIASIGGRVAVPHMAPYSASKAALVGLSDALYAELASRGVKVTTVCPGLMRTGSHLHARFRGNPSREATWFTASATAPLVTMRPERAARRIVAAGRRGDPYSTFNLLASMAIRAEGLMPGAARQAAALIARLLPRAGAGDGGDAVPGWRVSTKWLPPPLRWRGQRAARRHLEDIGIGTEA